MNKEITQFSIKCAANVKIGTTEGWKNFMNKQWSDFRYCTDLYLNISHKSLYTAYLSVELSSTKNHM